MVLKCELKVRASGVNGRQENRRITGSENERQLWDGRGKTWKKVIGERVAEHGLRKWRSGKSTVK